MLMHKKQNVLLPLIEKSFDRLKSKMIKFIIKLKIKLIEIYKYLFSPLLGNNCRYSQSCSEFYIDSSEKTWFNERIISRDQKNFKLSSNKKILGGGSSFDFVPEKKEIETRQLTDKKIMDNRNVL